MAALLLGLPPKWGIKRMDTGTHGDNKQDKEKSRLLTYIEEAAKAKSSKVIRMKPSIACWLAFARINSADPFNLHFKVPLLPFCH